MPDYLAPHTLRQFQELIALRLGLHFDESKEEWVGEILAKRVQQTSFSTPAAYLPWLRALPMEEQEWRILAQSLTIGETYFFRQPGHFQALQEIVLPARREARAAQHQKRLSMVSAGCSSGEEPYSLAIAAQETGMLADDRTVEIFGCDTNTAALEKARRARYSRWSMRALPEYLRWRHFHQDRRSFVLKDTIRQRVTFREQNLMDAAPQFWSPERFDVIFCRNVLMYFTPEATERILQRFYRALAPGGYLFLGHAENLHRSNTDFHVCNSHGSFYYQRHIDTPKAIAFSMTTPSLFSPEANDRVSPSPSPQESGEAIAPSPSTLEALQETVLDSHARIEEIADALEQKRAPAGPQAEPQNGQRTSSSTSLAYDAPELAEIWTLLRQERFDKALGLLRQRSGLLQDLKHERLFLEAALLFNTGQVAAARQACETLLATHDLHGHTYYLLALCVEQSGQDELAMKHTRMAIYLAPESAMPYLLLGRLARRERELSTVHKAFQEAIRLLPREDTPALLLFGGGFSREALCQMCEAELQAAGELA